MDKKEKTKISMEVAEAEFERFGLENKRDFDVKEMDDDEAIRFKTLKKRLCNQIQLENLVISEKGMPTYMPYMSGPDLAKHPFKFRPIMGQDYAQMDGAKSGKDILKTHFLISSITGRGIKQIGALTGVDYKVVTDLLNIFLDE